MPGGGMILELAFLDFEKDGQVIINNDQIAKANPRLGIRAAKTLCLFSGQEIPERVNHLVFKRGDWRNKSPRCFWQIWEKCRGRVFKQKFKEMVDDLIGAQKLKKIIRSAKKDISSLFETKKETGKRYFVHNDASPSNMFFGHDGKALLLDFEHAGVTRHQVLALITDLGNFSGRCWPNPKMQQEFLAECLKTKNLGSLKKRYKLIKGVLVFGTIFLAKYGMGTRQKEHQMSVSLLENLEKALLRIDQEYKSLSSMVH